jgi:putative addiction module component (TIGR02574 family)
MAPDAEKLLQEALSLSEDTRVDLAKAFLESVEHEPADEGADAAWSAEAKRRLEEVRSGAVKPVPWEEAEGQIFDPSDGPKGR